MRLLEQDSLDLIYNVSGNDNFGAIGAIRALLINISQNGNTPVNMLRITRSLDPCFFELAMDIIRIAHDYDIGVIYDIAAPLLKDDTRQPLNIKLLRVKTGYCDNFANTSIKRS